jgi:GMP synthase-like glutamine amidotransferase
MGFGHREYKPHLEQQLVVDQAEDQVEAVVAKFVLYATTAQEMVEAAAVAAVRGVMVEPEVMEEEVHSAYI